MVKDPVCEMEVDEKTTAYHTYWDHSATFYFCSERCKKVFDHGPEAEEMEKMSWWQRFIKRLGDSGKSRYGGKPPSCH